jgi:hypothetical protein
MVLGPNQPLPSNFLDGQLGLPRDLVSYLNAQQAKQVIKTTEISRYYLNGTTGNDSNDGRSPTTPKKHPQALSDSLPDLIKHHTVVHCSGPITFSDHVYIGSRVSPGVRLYFDGGNTWEDTGEGIQTTTGSSVDSLVVSGAGWSTDQHFGVMVRVLTGPAAIPGDDIRRIFSNTSDTVVPSKSFSVDPGTGATFEIIKPATSFQSTSGNKFIYITTDGEGGHNGSEVVFQRLTFGTETYPRFENVARGLVGGVVCEYDSAAVYMQDNTSLSFLASIYDVDSAFSLIHDGIGGISFIHPNAQVRVKWSRIQLSYSMFAGGLLLDTCHGPFWAISSRVKDGLIIDHMGITEGIAGIRNFSGWQASAITNASGPGILVKGGSAQIAAGVDISDCSTHGIEVTRNGEVYLEGDVTGTGNGSSGVYAHDRSTVFTKSGSPPTITGNSGTVDLSFDGSTQKAAWATVNTTPQLETTTDLLLAKAI